MSPGKSWIFLKISRSWKLNFKVLGSPGIYLWFKLTNMPFMYRTPCVNTCMKYSCNMLTEHFFATCDEHFAMHCTVTLYV